MLLSDWTYSRLLLISAHLSLITSVAALKLIRPRDLRGNSPSAVNYHPKRRPLTTAGPDIALR